MTTLTDPINYRETEKETEARSSLIDLPNSSTAQFAVVQRDQKDAKESKKYFYCCWTESMEHILSKATVDVGAVILNDDEM